MTQVVITGFRAFPGVPDNPSQRLIEHLEAERHGLPRDARLHLLDVDYRRVVPQIDAIMADPPEALILTGYSHLAKAILLEQRATALCAADKPDSAGFVPDAQTDATLETSIDLQALVRTLESQAIPAAISHDAGQYLCNFSYRHTLAAIAARSCNTKALFVHIPAIEGTDLAGESAAALPMEKLAAAMALIASEILR